MPVDAPPSDSILISFLSQEDERSDLAALTMVRRISQTCTLVLVEDQAPHLVGSDDRTTLTARHRIRRLMTIAHELDLKLEIVIREFQKGLEELSSRNAGDVIVLHQPHSALDRQTLVFRQIGRALSVLPNNVLYATTGASPKSQNVIAFAQNRHFAHAKLAMRLAGPHGRLEILDFEALQEVAQPDSQLRLRILSQSPAIILIEEAFENETDTDYSRLAAVMSTPVFVISSDRGIVSGK